MSSSPRRIGVAAVLALMGGVAFMSTPATIAHWFRVTPSRAPSPAGRTIRARSTPTRPSRAGATTARVNSVTGRSPLPSRPSMSSALDDVVEVTVGGVSLVRPHRVGPGALLGRRVGPRHRVGAGSETPVQVSGLADATALSANGNHTCAVRATGSVVCWGYNSYGQLGDGTSTTRSSRSTCRHRRRRDQSGSATSTRARSSPPGRPCAGATTGPASWVMGQRSSRRHLSPWSASPTCRRSTAATATRAPRCVPAGCVAGATTTTASWATGHSTSPSRRSQSSAWTSVIEVGVGNYHTCALESGRPRLVLG